MYEVNQGSLQILPDSALSFTEATGSLGAANPSRPSQSCQLFADRVRFHVPLEPLQRHTTDTTFAEMSRRSLDAPRRNLSYAQRPVADTYYHSRAFTQKKYRRRATTILEYCDENLHLLPQLPFTWHHGWKRWKLFIFALLVFVDASVIPITLYYGMRYAGEVEGWIIFAIVATIWGGPTYLEFAIRTLRLMKVDRFYRPLGTNYRWCFDMLTWVSILTITVVTVLFTVGSAPHNVWLRVLCMPAPAILYCLGGVLFLITFFSYMGWAAPFRISSTARGEKVLPGVYYFIEDIVAVNAGGGRPYREALVARYKASPRFRRLIYMQSWFWSIPALNLAIPLTIISVIPQVPATVAYGVAWIVPFLWATIWGIITIQWCKRDIARERREWEAAI
ncbi:hypothetical protein FOXB_00310 [Fusarium oxysporum f. sp. conglutinans Fo5176]|uniref:Uncharacterized protein n=2 Tax=Fusarium oxysporum f. sp. conglutinans TaxID=100902 RepID=F9F1N6_FUSOF|nr:hypothetical protein FOXB_00310 [Fusarium oxysporum f. sp. conglutinans Fo5176]KAG6999904.1 hypothetical protein FocnCong_v012042 [Fusarium oxysporum f. sp. conglutinans]KAI8405796.1 hypothetical protein FOFC_13257 [Fusarium oxysporum]